MTHVIKWFKVMFIVKKIRTYLLILIKLTFE